jgi:hypothetical protein
MAGSDGSSTGGRKRKRKSHPTSKARNRRQKAKAKDAKARESASALGVVAIAPERWAVCGEGASHLLRSMCLPRFTP